ncbi:ArsR/SmtB family transcription factor [Methanoregula sp.]|jgi:DNA-binding transcriptional ArsR family regulator|uniref:ArsR/SmtB family transcription factor n=1 Tax=Methanoregula sp. TaxID=2052170 RepID=UPI003C7588D6
MTGTVTVLEPGDERAQKIAKAMASQTANDILSLLSSGAISLSDITEKLKIPLTTAKYHIENMLDAGLITVSETRYSVKGREVKMYALTDQLLIVAPKKTNIQDLLLKYSSLFGIVIAGTLVVFALAPLLSSPVAPEAAALMTSNGAEVGAVPSVMRQNMMVQVTSLDPVLTFFLGGLLVIGALFCYELYLWKKRL